MSAITISQKSFIAFYTSDSSLPSGPQSHIFEYKREAEAVLQVSDSSGSSDTACALVRSNATGPCAMMCLSTHISMVTLTPSGSVQGEPRMKADTFEFNGG